MLGYRVPAPDEAMHRPNLKGVLDLRDRCIVNGSIDNNAAADAVRRLRRCHGRRL